LCQVINLTRGTIMTSYDVACQVFFLPPRSGPKDRDTGTIKLTRICCLGFPERRSGKDRRTGIDRRGFLAVEVEKEKERRRKSTCLTTGFEKKD
jgi:hypothetical protein